MCRAEGKRERRHRAEQLGMGRAACFSTPLENVGKSGFPSCPCLESPGQRCREELGPSLLCRCFFKGRRFEMYVQRPVKTSSSTEKNGSFGPQPLRRRTKDHCGLIFTDSVPLLQPVILRCKIGQPREVIFGVSLFILNPTLAVGSDFYVMILCSAYKEVLLVGYYERIQNISLQNKLVPC